VSDDTAFPPTHRAWVRHAVAWVRFCDGLATFETVPEE